ncbi:MAG TPA: DMT family transporter [Capsulimonadaceae bacterium]|jgi:drug/metabolite transporter (DMT)-like permease
MTPPDIARLLVLAAFWGASFIFIRIAAPTLGPALTVESRVVIASVLLAVYAAIFRTPLQMRERWKQYLVMAALNSVVPFTLVAYAELHITASMAVILNASTPIFVSLIAAVWLGDRLTAQKAAGMAISMTGIVTLVGWSPVPLTHDILVAVACCLVGAFCYGIGAVYTKAHMKDAPALGMAVGSLAGASMFGLIPAIAMPIPGPITQTVLVSITLLAVMSTAAAYVLFYKLVVSVGPAKATTVTFLTPIFGVVWGLLFLHESITASQLASCAIVLAGTGLVTLSRTAQEPDVFPAAD